MGYSTKWKTWKAKIDIKTCFACLKNHSKIYGIDEVAHPEPPIHSNCRCIIDVLKAIDAGMATDNGIKGADWYLMFYGKLPDYYITEKEAKRLGYRSYLGNLATVAPNRMLFKGIYQNKNGHLPMASGRVWYEADINYTRGYRGTERILFSNDGLIFVTYDHYRTFIEIE